MKYLSVGIFVFLIGNPLILFSQALSYDTINRSKIYVEKVAEFAADPVKKNDIVFLGNSITAGGDWKALLNLPTARNRGISGDITFGVLKRLDDVIRGKPSKIFILIGINDIARNIPDSLIVRNYKSIINRIQKGSKKTKIYFHTLLPVNSSFGKFKNHYGKEKHILMLNEEIRKLALEKNVTVIDLYSHFIDSEKSLRVELTNDGLHLTSSGYKIWIDLLDDCGYLK